MYLLLISTFSFCEAALSAEIVNLNRLNIHGFVKNEYALAFFCDFDHYSKVCDRSDIEFRKAADNITEENKFPIKFGKMDYFKNKWINEKIEKIAGSPTFMFCTKGKYEKFSAKGAEDIVWFVKKLKNYTDENPNILVWKYKELL